MKTRIPLLDLNRQHAPIRSQIDEAIRKVVDSTGFILGPEVKSFESAFASYIGVPHGVGCASGTDALYLALKALGIGPGDEVITVSYTFMATVGAIERTGATPVLVDIEPETFTIDTSLVEEAVTERTRAIIPVHLYGQAADMDEIMRIAAGNGIAVIEDCAQAHGAKWKGHKIGTFGTIAAFSFFPSKNLGAFGDAGICVTSDQVLADKMTRIRIHGRGNKNESFEKGDNSRPDTIQFAVLGVKLPHLDAWNASRQEVARWYNDRLSGSDRYVTPKVGEHREHVYHLYVVQSRERDALCKRLDEAGIAWGVHYAMPVHLMKGFANLGYQKGAMPVSEGMCGEIISLPLFPGMTEAEVDEVVKVLLA